MQYGLLGHDGRALTTLDVDSTAALDFGGVLEQGLDGAGVVRLGRHGHYGMEERGGAGARAWRR